MNLKKKQKDWTLRCKFCEWVIERVFMFVYINAFVNSVMLCHSYTHDKNFVT